MTRRHAHTTGPQYPPDSAPIVNQAVRLSQAVNFLPYLLGRRQSRDAGQRCKVASGKTHRSLSAGTV